MRTCNILRCSCSFGASAHSGPGPGPPHSRGDQPDAEYKSFQTLITKIGTFHKILQKFFNINFCFSFRAVPLVAQWRFAWRNITLLLLLLLLLLLNLSTLLWHIPDLLLLRFALDLKQGAQFSDYFHYFVHYTKRILVFGLFHSIQCI